MAKVLYLGKERHHVSVGKGKMYDYQDLQSAWDSITDSALANPYLISIGPGVWDGASPVDGEPYVWLFGKTDISIVGERSSIIRKTLASQGNTDGGGTLAIGKPGSMAERVRLRGFTIVNQLEGVSGASGGPPEGALYIGQEAASGAFSASQAYDDIEIQNMHIVGSHDALQLFGTVPVGDGGPATPGLVRVRNNIMESHHDCYTVKGQVRLFSQCNKIFVNSADSSIAHLTTGSAWKHTGIHYNCGFDVNGGLSTDRAGAINEHIGEQIYVISNGNYAGIPQGGDQRVACGIYVYAASIAEALMYPELKFDGCTIRLVHIPDTAILNGLDGIQVSPNGTGGMDIADGEFIFANGRIDVHQSSTGNNPPATVTGVRLRGSTSGNQTLRVTNSRIRVRNDRGTSPVAYAMETEAAGHTILHRGVSWTAADGMGDTTGVIRPDGELEYVEDTVLGTAPSYPQMKRLTGVPNGVYISVEGSGGWEWVNIGEAT